MGRGMTGGEGQGVCVKPVTLTDDTQLTLLASDIRAHYAIASFCFAVCLSYALPFNITSRKNIMIMTLAILMYFA